MTKRHAEYLVMVFFVCLIGVVFQQIATSMTQQGIASGTPYDNAAAYPRAVAVFMGGLLIFGIVAGWRQTRSGHSLSPAEMMRPAGLLGLFAVYLFALGILGYHLSTPPMLVALLWLGGYRRPVPALIYGLGISFGAAFLFEVFLKIVLPGGFWRLNIPW